MCMLYTDLSLKNMYRALEAVFRNARAVNPTRLRLPCLLNHRCSTTPFTPDNATTRSEEELKRFNPLEIQMLSRSLHDQVFHGEMETYDAEMVKKCQQHLEEHNLWNKSGTVLPEVDFELPPLLGSNIDEHFRNIAEEQSRPHFEKAQMLAELTLSAIPDEWSYSPGWTKYVYTDEGLVTSPVDVPQEDALIFDVEVCMNEGPFPVIAVAASPKAW